MPRREPSPAERVLAAAASKPGRKVSPRQLERWRERELLPPLPRQALGRGAGSRSWVTDELIRHATAVADAVAATSTLDEAALTLFVRGDPVSEAAVRRAYRGMLDALAAEVEANEKQGDQSPYDALDRLARKLARRSAGSGAERWRERLRKSGGRARLADANYALLAAAVTGTASSDEGLLTLATAAGADAIVTERIGDVGPIAEALDLTALKQVIAESDIFTLVGRSENVEWRQLCAARDLVVRTRDLARALVPLAAREGANEAFGLREFAEQSDLQLAIPALAATPMINRDVEDAEAWEAVLAEETPRFQAALALLEALPSELAAGVSISDPEALQRLDPQLREDLRVAVDAWLTAHPAEARSLENGD